MKNTLNNEPSLIDKLKDLLSKPPESFLGKENKEENKDSGETYKLTHSNCCDAILLLGDRCAKCGEPAGNQYE